MIGSNINKVLVYFLALIFKAGLCYAQVPTITTKTQPIPLTLDATGDPLKLTINDVGSVTPDAKTVTFTPAQFTCSDVGLQTLTITASEGTAPVTFNQPTGIVTDKAGNIFIADTKNHKIRELAVNGDVTDFAGSGTVGTQDGLGTAASFDTPEGIAIDAAGNLYVTDATSGLIRKITPAGLVSTLAGTAYSTANDKGTGFGVSFDQPYGIAIDSHNNVFVADAGGNKIRKVTPDGQVSTFAGSAQGYSDGKAVVALFNQPAGIAIDGAGNIYVADTYNNRIRKITPAGDVTTIAGNNQQAIVDGVGTGASFDLPFNLISDGAGNIYVADTQSQAIRKIDVNNAVTTIAGNNTAGNKDGYKNGNTLNLPIAQFNTPIGLTITASGNLLVGDVQNNEVRQIAAGYTGTLAGNGTAGNTNGNINYSKLHSSTTQVQVDVKSYLKITNTYADVPLTACDNVLPDFTKINPPQIIDNCFTNVVPRQNPPAGTPVASNSTTLITITVEDPTGLGNTDAVSFNVYGAADIYAPPGVSISPSIIGPVCSNATLTFTATPANAGTPTFQWMVNGAAKGTNSPTFTSTFNNGDIVLCNILSSQCSAPASSSPYTVSVEPAPTVAFNSDATIKNGSSVQLSPAITGDIMTYLWSPADGVSDVTIANPVLSPTKTTTYTLTVTSTSGCIGSGSVNVTVFDVVVVPNTFTPNGDGINDQWDIPALVVYPNCVVSIYNRYGILVYHTIGYPKSWDGTYKGKALSTGTYYYVIDLKNGKPKMSGSVTIIK